MLAGACFASQEKHNARPAFAAASIDYQFLSAYGRASETFTPPKIAIARARRLHEEC